MPEVSTDLFPFVVSLPGILSPDQDHGLGARVRGEDPGNQLSPERACAACDQVRRIHGMHPSVGLTRILHYKVRAARVRCVCGCAIPWWGMGMRVTWLPALGLSGAAAVSIRIRGVSVKTCSKRGAIHTRAGRLGERIVNSPVDWHHACEDYIAEFRC